MPACGPAVSELDFELSGQDADRGCGAQSLARAATRAAGDGAVDEVLIRRRHVADDHALAARGAVRCRLLMERLMRRGRACRQIEFGQRSTGLDHVARLSVLPHQLARVGAGYLDHCLGGFHRQHGLVQLQVIAFRDVPRDDFCFG
jgi:hypothetical protein